jgi:L-ribulose-5-phosphate 4-epimerase
MQNHGVFTIGPSAKAAVKAAVMCEDNAKSAWIATALGEPIAIPEAAVESLYNRYQNNYGN